jgi:hypothetical protein
MEAGVDALLHDKTRKPGKAPVPEPVVALIERTLGPPPGETTHWTSIHFANAIKVVVTTTATGLNTETILLIPGSEADGRNHAGSSMTAV